MKQNLPKDAEILGGGSHPLHPPPPLNPSLCLPNVLGTPLLKFSALFVCFSTKKIQKVLLQMLAVLAVKSVYVKASKHEISQSHIDCVKAYIACISRKDLQSVFEKEAIS